MEVLLPWSNLGIKAEQGGEIDLRCLVNDGGPQITSHLLFGNGMDKGYRLRLSDHASKPITVAASGWYEHLRRIRINARGVATKGDSALELRDAVGQITFRSAPLSEGKISSDFSLPLYGQDSHLLPTRSVATTSGSVTGLDRPKLSTKGPFTILLDGREVARVALPDLAAARAEAIRKAKIAFAPNVFDSSTFPKCDFTDPTLMEDLLGRYDIKVTFYDNDFNRVESAEKPGRYGAIVEVLGGHGGTLARKCLTLYRTPPGAGSSVVVDFRMEPGLTDLLTDGATSDDFRAMLLAAGTNRLMGRDGAFERNREWWYRLRQKIGDHPEYRYLVNLPKEYDTEPAKKWPLVVFLHGAGERGGDIEKVKSWGPPKLAAAGKAFPFVVVSPQCPEGEHWLPAEVMGLVDEVSAKYRVDADRIYLTGLSMGGFGTWQTAATYPDRLAAIAPICGGGDPEDAGRMKRIPTWAFHGKKDLVVPFSLSKAMVDALKDAGARDVRLTAYPEAGHNSWSEAYDDPELYRWLLAQSRTTGR
jgi:pimeloyl-ACP methyl ester carboxylesterase